MPYSTRSRKHLMTPELVPEVKIARTSEQKGDVFTDYKKAMGFESYTDADEFKQNLEDLYGCYFLPFVTRAEKRYEAKKKVPLTVSVRRIIWGKEFFYFAGDVLHDVFDAIVTDGSQCLIITAEELCKCANIGGKLAGEFLSSALDDNQKPLVGPLSYDMKGYMEMLAEGEFEHISSVLFKCEKVGETYIVRRKTE